MAGVTISSQKKIDKQGYYAKNSSTHRNTTRAHPATVREACASVANSSNILSNLLLEYDKSPHRKAVLTRLWRNTALGMNQPESGQFVGPLV